MVEGGDSEEEEGGNGGKCDVTWRRVAWRWSSASPWDEEACGCAMAATGIVEEGSWEQ